MSDSRKSSDVPKASSQKSRPETSGGLKPLVPRPPAIPLRPLASKPPAATTSTHRKAPRPRCPVPCVVCLRTGCKLTTHKKFIEAARQPSQWSSGSTSPGPRPDDPKFASSYAYKLAQQYVDRDILTSKSDPVYSLPTSSQFNTPQYQRLFHDWFVHQSQLNFLIPRPAEMVGDLICSSFLVPATQDSALCLSVLSLAAAVIPIRSQQPSRNVTSLTLVGEAMQELRERIKADPQHVSDLTIMAAVNLWAVNAYLQDEDAMKFHGQSVRNFVESRGGMHKLGMVGAVEQSIRWVDIVHSLTFCTRCSYLDFQPPQPTSNSPRSHYGGFWSAPSTPAASHIDPEVVLACRETCRLMELLEEADREGTTPGEYLQLLHGLRRAYTTESVLREKYYQRGNVNECISVANSLIKICAFHGNHQPQAMLIKNAAWLASAIKCTGGPAFWKEDMELLTWLLFVAVMVPVEHEGDEWCLDLLTQVLVTGHSVDGKWNSGWKARISASLRKFCWCEVRFNEFVSSTCRKIMEDVASQHGSMQQDDKDEDDDHDDDDDDSDDSDEHEDEE